MAKDIFINNETYKDVIGYFNPQFSTDDDEEYVIIGIELAIPPSDDIDELKEIVHANEDYLTLIAGSDQKVQVQVALGSSMKDILDN